ncbi:hypothetical protein GCM10010472_22790 [Pseudonocardia halophobica]|uniref:Uncharacterized protein n=1 Tax=Pseudonocardia halophobica TaxID=29401 RepID=A0A9W6KWS6_9PSEU|nr:hypothetical protein GCM10017577_06520 [Pseudonocardia halophobica]
MLRAAATELRASCRAAARGPWRWAGPDPEVVGEEGHGHPLSAKDLAPPSSRVVVGPTAAGPTRVGHVRDPRIAEALADLLTALADQAERPGTDAAAEPYRSALAVAAALRAER